MSDANSLLEFTENLIHTNKCKALSDLQRFILLKSLQGERVTYDKLAESSGYSVNYVRQDIAPKLWQLLSELLGQKVFKSNVRTILENELLRQQAKNLEETVSTLPIKNPSSPSLLQSNSISKTEKHFSEFSLLAKESVLIVDDRSENLELLSDILESKGYEVRQALGGKVALQSADWSPPGLVLLDVSMPDMDGYEVCQLFKGNPRTSDIPIIFVSALDEPWDKVKGFTAGGVDYITKPFNVAELIARVENHLRIRRLQQALQKQNVDLQRALEELHRLSAIDTITQLPNRGRFDSYLQKSWEASVIMDAPVALMLCSIDGFESFNTRYGNATGERYLRTIARLINVGAAKRKGDLACRFAGTIFAVILPGLTVESLRHLAEGLLHDFQVANFRPVNSANSPQLILNIGGTVSDPDDASNPQACVKRCENALELAKSSDGNTFKLG